MSVFIDQILALFTDSTTGLIPALGTGFISVLTAVLPYVGGFIILYMLIRWIYKMRG